MCFASKLLPTMVQLAFSTTMKGKIDKWNFEVDLENRKFWAEDYFVSTVGLNETAIVKYNRKLEKHDIALDKLSIKEYEAPFR